MKVKMFETKMGSPNGFTIQKYYKDEVYDLPKKLYDSFKKAKWCKDLVETGVNEVIPANNQAIPNAPNTKTEINEKEAEIEDLKKQIEEINSELENEKDQEKINQKKNMAKDIAKRINQLQKELKDK